MMHMSVRPEGKSVVGNHDNMIIKYLPQVRMTRYRVRLNTNTVKIHKTYNWDHSLFVPQD